LASRIAALGFFILMYTLAAKARDDTHESKTLTLKLTHDDPTAQDAQRITSKKALITLPLVAYIIADVGLSIIACVKCSIAFSNLPNHKKRSK